MGFIKGFLHLPIRVKLMISYCFVFITALALMIFFAYGLVQQILDTKLMVGDTGYSYIVDSNGNIVVHPGFAEEVYAPLKKIKTIFIVTLFAGFVFVLLFLYGMGKLVTTPVAAPLENGPGSTLRTEDASGRIKIKDLMIETEKMKTIAGLSAGMVHEIAAKNNIVMTAYGHCGSGCMHTKILMDTKRGDQWASAKKAITEVYEYVRSVNGTTSAEHGIGLSKAESFKIEKSDSLNILAGIKRAFDPNNIMNPGKLAQAPENWVTATNLRYSVNQ